MDWIKPSLFALSLFILLGLSDCRVGDESKMGVARRYEECVLSRLSRSRFFKEQDRSRLLKAVEESNHSEKKVGTVLRSFTTTATELVAGSNSPLQDAYVTVTETCSLSLPQHLAEEVMREVQKILSEEPDGQKTTPTEETVLSRRREIPSPPPDLKVRRKRSPQAAFWQPAESLQTVLSNILLNSNPFQNVFSGRTSRRDAIFYARSMVESGLYDYHFSVVQDAVSSVVNAISNFPFQPEANDYAIAVANGIASVLDARELSFFADGAGIGNAMVSRLQVMLNNNRRQTSQSSSFGGAAASSSFSWSSGGNNQQQQRPNFQMNPGFLPNIPLMNPGPVMNPPMNPGAMMNPAAINPSFVPNPSPMQNPQTNPGSTFLFEFPQSSPAEEFQSDMAFYLYQSDTIQGAFCSNGPFPGTYEMVNEGLSEYGLPLSVIAASSATDSLSSMNPSEACAEFGNVIAESVTSALRDTDLLQSADAQTIVDRMASSIGQSPPPSGPPVYFDPPPPSEPNPPQSPDYGMPPYVPMEETQSQGAPDTLEPTPQSTDSAAMPPQETKSQVEYPLLDPSFVPADYAVDTATLTGADVPTGQESPSDVSRDQQPDEPQQSRPDDQQQDATAPPSRDEVTTTTQGKEPENVSSTPADVITATTTPYPDAATTPSAKAMGTILKDIFTALRSMNRTSDDKPDTGSNKDDVVTTLSPPTAPEMERADSSSDANTPDSSSVATPTEAPVELQPSFMSTPPPRNPTTPEDDDDSDLRDPTVVFAHHVSDIASAAIAMIRSRSVSLPELCEKLNPLASVVDIPPLDVCGEVALVDFLLNILKAVTFVLRGV